MANNNDRPKYSDFVKVAFNNGKPFMVQHLLARHGQVEVKRIEDMKITAVGYLPNGFPTSAGFIDKTLCGSESANDAPPPGAVPATPTALRSDPPPAPKKTKLRVVK